GKGICAVADPDRPAASARIAMVGRNFIWGLRLLNPGAGQERISQVCPDLGRFITAGLRFRRDQSTPEQLRYAAQRANQLLPPPSSTLESVVPSAAGLSATAMPANFMASTLSSALPLPPAMMAPAWPMRRPGGAVMPAMKPAMGFLRPFLASLLMNSAASSSDAPPISPIMMMELVAGSARNI